MDAKKRWHALILPVLVVGIIVLGYFVFTEQYVFALISLVLIMVPVKVRKRLGHMGPRQALFAMHMACNTAFMTALLLLIFHIRIFWLVPLAHVSYVGMVITGASLIVQSKKRELSL